MDNKVIMLALLLGLMLLLGCAAQAGSAKSAPNTSAPAGSAANNSGAPAFPADITEDAGFNDTYKELDAVQ